MRKNKKLAILVVVCMLVMMLGTVAQAASAPPVVYEGYTATLNASCTRTLATVKMTYGGIAAIYACGTVRYTSKYNLGTGGTTYTKDIAEDGVGNVTATYTPNSADYNVSVVAWGRVRTVKVIGNITAAAGLVR